MIVWKMDIDKIKADCRWTEQSAMMANYHAYILSH